MEPMAATGKVGLLSSSKPASPYVSWVLAVAKPLGQCVVKVALGAWQAKHAIKRITGWAIVDPLEPLLALALVSCIFSWILSFVGVMEFRGYLTTLVIASATWRIRVLGSLKEELDCFVAENERFREGNRNLKHNVNQLNAQNDKLRASNQRLETSVQSLNEVKEAMERYASETKGDISAMLTTLHNSIEEQRRVQQQTLDIEIQTRKLTQAQERSMLMGLFMQFQDMDGQKGLSRYELDTLADMLPDASSSRLRSKLRDFEAIDADRDGVISMANFRDCVRRIDEDMHGSDGSMGSMPAQLVSHQGITASEGGIAMQELPKLGAWRGARDLGEHVSAYEVF
mmetsp:Transcript_56525/g.112384  ORF Transcript_56525/g.112384 Transcript_56525/m.112384 type:complete len:342 (-) Transcript_56525:46-1071(-)